MGGGGGRCHNNRGGCDHAFTAMAVAAVVASCGAGNSCDCHDGGATIAVAAGLPAAADSMAGARGVCDTTVRCQPPLACDLDGNVRWKHKYGGFGGAELLAVEGDLVYVGNSSGSPQVLFRLDTPTGSYQNWDKANNGGFRDIFVKDLWKDQPGMPDKAEAMAARNGFNPDEAREPESSVSLALDYCLT